MLNKRFKHVVFNYGEPLDGADVHDYLKLKFEDRELTDYEFLLWVKLFYYMKYRDDTSPQGPSLALMDALRNEYNLPSPSNVTDNQLLFDKIRDHEWIKLQDSTGKYLFGPFSGTVSLVPSFDINRFQRSLNRTIEFLRAQIHSGEITDELREKTLWMMDCIRGINYSVGRFFTGVLAGNRKDTLTDDLKSKSVPYSSYQTVCQQIYEIIRTILDIPQKDWKANGFEDEMRMPVVLPQYIESKGIAGFSCLCGFFVDAMFFSFDYPEPLLKILLFLHSDFHCSLLWRVEFAASPVSIEIPVNQRGQQHHTTQMKIYLFDKKDRPRVIRIDMPHKGEGDERFLHFNVQPVFEDEQFDHQVITYDCVGIQSVLESVREAMIRECPNLFDIQDSDADADDAVLDEMRRFLAYNDIATQYVARENEIEALMRYNELCHTEYTTLSDALGDAYLFFYNRF